MILNDIERAVICGKQEYRTNSDFIEAIESAVIAKLAQGVSVEPVHHIMSDGVAIGYYSLDQLTTIAAAQGQDLLEVMCARIKAADDAMADGNYMLDSDDCISVIRGTWKPPMLNDKPAAPTPQAAAQPPAPSDAVREYMTGYSDGREWAAAPIPQQPSVPEGWKLVPIEPTEAMLEVGFFAENDVFDSAKTKRIHVWKDMLSAAPQPKETK